MPTIPKCEKGLDESAMVFSKNVIILKWLCHKINKG